MNMLNKIVKNTTFEENIFVEGYGLLRYTLSNDLNKILEAITLRTGIEDFSFIERFGWSENFALSENVKKVMKRLNVTFSMAYFTVNNVNCVVINKFENGRWFITGVEWG